MDVYSTPSRPLSRVEAEITPPLSLFFFSLLLSPLSLSLPALSPCSHGLSTLSISLLCPPSIPQKVFLLRWAHQASPTQAQVLSPGCQRERERWDADVTDKSHLKTFSAAARGLWVRRYCIHLLCAWCRVLKGFKEIFLYFIVLHAGAERRLFKFLCSANFSQIYLVC